MTEDTPRREPPVIHGLFPISSMAINRVEVDTLWPGGSLKEKFREFREENEAVLSYIGNLGDLLEKETKGLRPSSFYLLGATFCYAVLRAEAQLRGGILPKIPDDIIQDYTDHDLDHTEDLPRRKQRYKMFLNQEPELSEAINSKYRNLSPHQYSSLVNGIMDIYGIFHMNAEFKETHVLQPLENPFKNLIGREKTAIQELAMLYPLPEDSAIPPINRDSYDKLQRARLIAYDNPTAPVVEGWLTQDGLIIKAGQREYALAYISTVIALKTIKKLENDQNYTRDELESMRQETIFTFFALERLLESKKIYSRDEMVQIRNLVEKTYEEKVS